MKLKSLILILFFFTFSITEKCHSQTYSPGEIYFDSTGFVEYRAGNLPIILSAPHGGNWSPDSIPDRDCTGCSYLMDSYTRVISWGLYNKIYEITGCYPYLIMNRLHRRKFDANRDIGDAADGNPLIEQAWHNYHDFINGAKSKIEQHYGKGLFLDVHGHSHTIQRIELGYLFSGQELREPDEVLNSNTFIESSAIRSLVNDNILDLRHSGLLRGDFSFGTLLDDKGFPSVPSATDPFPDIGEPYFSGGYNTGRHGSGNNDGFIDAIQIEMNQEIRFDDDIRDILIDSLAHSIIQYIDLHYDDNFIGNYCNAITDVAHQEILNFSLYPNPAKDYISVQSDADHLSMEISDYLGQVVLSLPMMGETINIDQLYAGYYFVILKSEGKIVGCRKLLKLP